MIVQILVVEKHDKVLKNEVIDKIFIEGLHKIANSEQIKIEKKVLFNSGVYHWDENLKKAFKRTFDDTNLIIESNPKVTIGEHFGFDKIVNGIVSVARFSAVTTLKNFILNDIKKYKPEDDNLELSLNRVFTLDFNDLETFMKTDVTAMFKDSLFSEPLGDMLENCTIMYACVTKDSIDKLNNL